MFHTIGPVWDGNEVWLVVAGGATFAAFPAWYGTMFSGFYLALLLVLVLLIVRVVSFEWRAKSEARAGGRPGRGRTRWQLGAPLLWGIVLSSLLYGVPSTPTATLRGISRTSSASTPCSQGSPSSPVRLPRRDVPDAAHDRRAARTREARAAAPIPAAWSAALYLVWTVVVAVDRNDKDVFPPALRPLSAIAALALAVVFLCTRRSGRAFALTAPASPVVATLFTSLYPRVMVSSTDFGNSLTIESTASSHYALQVMTVAALILTPLVLLYQGWTYYVFRRARR